MSGSVKVGLMIIGGVLAIGLVMRVLAGLVQFIVPIAIIAGIGLIAWGLMGGKKSLGDSRRNLP